MGTVEGGIQVSAIGGALAAVAGAIEGDGRALAVGIVLFVLGTAGWVAINRDTD